MIFLKLKAAIPGYYHRVSSYCWLALSDSRTMTRQQEGMEEILKDKQDLDDGD